MFTVYNNDLLKDMQCVIKEYDKKHKKDDSAMCLLTV